MTATWGGQAATALSTSALSVAVTLPAGIANGNIGYISHTYNPTTGATTTPAGWTLVRTDTFSTTAETKLYRKSLVTGDSSATVTFTNSGSQRMSAGLGVLKGVTAEDVVNVRVENVTTPATNTAPTATAGTLDVQMVFWNERSTSPSTAMNSAPSGVTVATSAFGVGSGACSVVVGYDLTPVAAAGTLGGSAWDPDVSNNAVIMYVIGVTVDTAVTGTAAVIQAAQTSTATGQLGYTGTVAKTQAAQTSTASGGLLFTGTVARTQAAQTSSATGAITSPPPTSAPSAANRSPFRIQIYNTSFAKQGEVNSYQSVEFTLRLNAVGSWTIKLNPSDQAVQELVQKRRRITVDYKGVRILSGPVELRRQLRDENGLRVYEFGGPDDLIWLTDRLAYPNPGGTIPGDNVVFTQTVTDDIRRGNGETVIKGYVTANAVTRLAVPGLTVATNLNRGSTTTGSARMISLLDTVAPVANGSGLGISLKQVGTTGMVFDVFAPQTQPVRLSENLKNLKAWEYVEEAPGATRVVVGGQGDGTAKKFLKRTLSTSETDWEIREQFYDATDVDTDADLPIRGAEYLGQNAPQAGFSVTPEDSDSMSFAVNYNLGDVVTVEVTDGVFESDTVKQVVLAHAVGGIVTVQPAIGNLDAADKTNAIYRAFKDLLRRMARQERKA